jgi:uncharacterized damage-inducible protein DinB
MELTDCRMLFAHAQWADALAWKAVLGAGIEDAELREKLHHLHLVQWGYLRIWQGAWRVPPALETFPSLDTVRDWARETHREVASFLETVPPERVGEEVAIPWVDYLVERYGMARPSTWSETVLQVAMHSTYHRGQVARRLRELGAEPALTDLIAWIWAGRPEAEW